MVSVKFALKDAPNIGKGRWTWPLQSLNDATLIQKIVKRGIKTQEKINRLNHNRTSQEETTRSTPQLLWKEFKTDIQK